VPPHRISGAGMKEVEERNRLRIQEGGDSRGKMTLTAREGLQSGIYQKKERRFLARRERRAEVLSG